MRTDTITRKQETMKAIRLHSTSVPTGMVYEAAPQQHPKEGEVLVRVYAAAITPGEHLWSETWKTATGQERLRPIPGHEFSGVVVETGLGVTQFAVGDAVYGYTDARRDGAEAEYCLALPTELALKPSSLDHVQAAAVPLSALTAWQTFFDHAQLSAGQRVLIHGAVLPLLVVDNSAFPPKRLTIPLGPDYPS
jgi:NADPH:quinone reductase-like Zn-dependent oxidoreductase